MLGHEAVAGGQHAFLHDPERLSARRGGVERAEPRRELLAVPLADLGEGQPVPVAELHLGEAGLLGDRHAEHLGEQVGRLTRATHRRGHDRVDRVGQRGEPGAGRDDLLAALLAERRVVAAETAGEPLGRRVHRDAVAHEDQRGGRAAAAPAASRRRRARGSQTRLGGADQDPRALLTADDLVGGRPRG